MSWLCVAAFVTWFFGYGTLPCIPVCIALFTGEIYVPKPDADGSLKKWGWPNKAAAYILLLLNTMPIALLFLPR